MGKHVDKKQIERVRKMPFSSVYPLYKAKLERKGLGDADLDAAIRWLTGYTQEELMERIEENCSFEDFFNGAARFNPEAGNIKGAICGYVIEEIEDAVVRQTRQLDKLVDEMAKGKTAEDVIRKYSQGTT